MNFLGKNPKCWFKLKSLPQVSFQTGLRLIDSKLNSLLKRRVYTATEQSPCLPSTISSIPLQWILKKKWRQGRKTGRTIIIPCICVMCESVEIGRWLCLGGREGRRGEDTRRLNPNEGAFCILKAPVCLQQMDYCLLSLGEWVLRAFQGGLFFIPYFTSLSSALGFLLHSVMFAIVVCASVYLTFVHLF